MSDGLLSIKDKRKPINEKSVSLNQEPFNMTYKSKKFNPYKYVSPTLVNGSPVSLVRKYGKHFLILISHFVFQE
jgi:hypothetical protein